MRALTLIQPWTTLVAAQEKGPETRSWGTDYRGPLAIHAAATIPSEVRYHVLGQKVRGWGHPGYSGGNAAIVNALYRHGYAAGGVAEGKDLPLGVVVATVNLLGVLPITTHWVGRECIVRTDDGLDHCVPPDDERHAVHGAFGIFDISAYLPFGDYTPGRYAWLYDNVVALEMPIPAKGALGLWNWRVENCPLGGALMSRFHKLGDYGDGIQGCACGWMQHPLELDIAALDGGGD